MKSIYRTAQALFAMLLLLAAGVSSAVSPADVRRESPIIGAARIPFVANEGQVANPEVKYYARTFGGTVYALNGGRVVYSLPRFEGRSKSGAKLRSGSVVIAERLNGILAAEPAGSGKSGVAISSFIGNRPEQWRSDLPAFDRVDFGEVYEGVSFLLRAHGNNVEKIFVLAPGADPGEIALRYEGALGLEITGDGQLELETALGPVYFTRPVAWQAEASGSEETFNAQRSTLNIGLQSVRSKLEVEGWKFDVSSDFAKRADLIPIEVGYALDEDGTVRFELGPYDRNKTLIIDPLLAATFIGGGGADAVQAIAVDSSTNVYIAGYTASTDFPVTNNPYSSINAGNYDVFVSRFNADLTTLAASTYLGGSSNDMAYAMGIDYWGYVWIAGYTESANFPTPSSPMDTGYNGQGDAFVAIVASNLNSLVSATYLGGTNVDRATAIAMDNLTPGQYVVGYTESANFPVTNSAGYATNYNGARDGFVAQFSNAVTRAAYKTGIFLGGTDADEATGITLSPGGITNDVFVAGFTASTNFPVTNAYQRIYGGGSNDAFVSRLSGLLTNLVGSTFLGGSADDAAYTVGLDLSNRVYVAGYTRSGNFPVTAAGNIYLPDYTNAYRGGQDIFVSCLTNGVTNLFSSTYIGGLGDDVAQCLLVDSAASATQTYVMVAGYTTSSNFPVTRAAYDRAFNGGEDAFLLRIGGNMLSLSASTYLGGGGNDRANALAFAPGTSVVYAAGISASSDFPSSDTAFQNVFGGGASDGFVTKMPAALAYGTVKWKKFLTGICSSPALTWDGTVAVGVSTGLLGFTSAGIQRWFVATTSAVGYQVFPLEGIGAPAVGTNNVIYINTKTGKVYAVNSGGALSWSLALGVAAANWSSIALGNEGEMYFTQEREFIAMRQSNPSVLWTNTYPVSSYSKPSPVISSNEIVYTAIEYLPGILYAFETDGSTSRVWTTDGSSYASAAINTNGIIYQVSTNRLYAFNPDGTTARTWQADAIIYSSPAIGSNGTIYVGGGSNLYALNPEGGTTKVWRASGEVKSSPAIAADGSIIVGTVGTNVYSFNADGTTNWIYDADDEFHCQAPLIDSEGTIYISDNSSVYALYGAQPPADSGWPMYKHDSLRTANQGMNAATLLRPTGLAVSKGTISNYIQVGWNASSNAISYELWRSPTNSTAGAARLRRLTRTNYNDSAIDGGRIYYYWVKVRTPVAMSVFSAGDSGGVPPFPPAGVTASEGMPTNYVQVYWTAASNAALYTVYRSLTDDTSTAAVVGSSADTNYSDTTVAPGFRYYYWIKASNAEAGESGFSASDGGGIPAWYPDGITASQGAYIHQVNLSWNSSTGASFYIVFRNPENNPSTAALLQETGDLALSDTAVTPMRRYYYWLKATNEFGLSGFSPSTIGWGLLAPVQSVQASAGTFSNMVRVSWEIGSTDATSHVVFRNTNSDFAASVMQSEVVYNDPTATNYDDTAITRGISYYYWAAAKNSYGTSDVTAAASPGGTAPAIPMNVEASDGVYSNMVKVSWMVSPGAIYYTVYRAETFDSSAAQPIGSALTNAFEDRSAIMGVLYYFWVKAANNYGLSDISSFNSGWRGLIPPDNVTAGDGISTSEVSVSWSASASAAGYELWRGTSANISSASRLANNIAAMTYSDSSAAPGTVYYYWVKAKRGIYVSAFSASDQGYRAIGELDLAVSELVFVPAIYGLSAHPAAVSFKVSNLSASDMVDPNNVARYDFYLARNPVFGDGEAFWFGGTNSTLNLNAGDSSRVVFSGHARQVIAIPVWAAGSYYVFVFINHALPSGWRDPNLANNVVSRVGGQITIASATAFQPVWNDFDGDDKSDFAVYQQGAWKVWLSDSGYVEASVTGIGQTGNRAVPRDYDCDGKMDPAVYDESTGAWKVCLSGSGYQTVLALNWGGSGQKAVPSDYDADGKVDPAVYQASSGLWRAWLSDSGYSEISVSGMGGAGWDAVPADYDGDGFADPAVYQQGTWKVWLSGNGYSAAVVNNWGGSGWRAVPADYDADGRIDPAVYHEATGSWYVWSSANGYRPSSVSGWGGSGQTAVPGDYDGDGRVDPVVYWQTMGMWRLWLSSYLYSEMDVLTSGGEGFPAITPWE